MDLWTLIDEHGSHNILVWRFNFDVLQKKTISARDEFWEITEVSTT